MGEGSGSRSALIALLTDLSEGEGLLSLRGLKELACHKLSEFASVSPRSSPLSLKTSADWIWRNFVYFWNKAVTAENWSTSTRSHPPETGRTQRFTCWILHQTG